MASLVSDDEIAREIGECITEYLQFHDMSGTLEAFMDERRKLHMVVPPGEGEQQMSRDDIYLMMVGGSPHLAS